MRRSYPWYQIGIVLILGLGIGGLTPWITQALPISGQNRVNIAQPLTNTNTYYCRIDNGILSVVQGLPTQGGRSIVTGLNVSKWPPEMLTMAGQIEFHSLDEVQSFIDSISEEL